jgi:hypothetical protein
MRNLIENPPLQYQEHEIYIPTVSGYILTKGTVKQLLDLTTGKVYLRTIDIGAEPQNVPQNYLLQAHIINVDTKLKPTLGKITQLNDDAGNSYTLYAEIL